MRKARKLLSRLKSCISGVAMTEFALAMPFFLTAGLWGVEMANLAITRMRISQLAATIADNASRVGDTSTLENRRVFETDINDIMRGAALQSGKSLSLFEHGRVFISGLEIWNSSIHCTLSSGCPLGSSADGQQFIHWQRCTGKMRVNSSYGNQNAALPNGIGPAGSEVMATTDSPVIFVEVVYEYQPLVSSIFVGNPTINSIASFMVRDSRDRTGLLQRNAASPDAVALCNVYDNPYPDLSIEDLGNGGATSTGGTTGGGSGGGGSSSTGGSSTSTTSGGSTTSSTSGGSTTTSTGGTSTSTTSGGSTTTTSGGSSSRGGSTTTTSGGSSGRGGGSTTTTSGGSTTTTSGGSSGRGGGRAKL